MGEIFTFVGLVVHDYKVMIAVHILIVGIGILILAKLATRISSIVFANITSTKVKPRHLKATFTKRFLHLLL